MSLITELKKDFDIFIDEWDETAQLPGNITINVMFNDFYEQANLDTGIVESFAPQIVAKSSDVSNIVHGNTIIVNGISYKAIEIQPDGGLNYTTIILSK